MWYNRGYMPKGIYKRTPDTIAKLVNRNRLGLQRWSAESRRKRAELSKKIHPNGPMMNKKHSEETKALLKIKIREAQTSEVRIKKSLSHRGEKNANWKGGRSNLKHQIRTSFKYRQWRSDIFKRDNYTCIWCGDDKGGNLEADHIIPLRDILDKYQILSLDQADRCERLWDLNNGRTLCEMCHIKRHKLKIK